MKAAIRVFLLAGCAYLPYNPYQRPTAKVMIFPDGGITIGAASCILGDIYVKDNIMYICVKYKFEGHKA